MITVTAAIIRKNGRILAARKKEGTHLAGFWEFPGGKVEENESPEHCLARELREELGIDAKIGSFFAQSCYDYGIKSIQLLAFLADCNDDTLTLCDHDRVQWLEPGELGSLKWAPADQPIVEKLMQLTE